MIIFVIISIVLICIFLRPKYQEPHVIRNAFTGKMCDRIIELASRDLKPSTVSQGKDVDDTKRKSETAWLNPKESASVEKLMEKCVSLTDRQFDNAEYLQVLKYTPGGFYKPHQDAFENEKNPRLYTCIVALNDDYEGGETTFPVLGKDFKLNKGDVLLFNTLNDWGRITAKAIHGGKPVLSGEKWICNLWIHKYPYELFS
jgi:hypothetical protein|tara:strand:+ start:272 stop:874 length:603 start_codon:yes stop_codon:yes gene_type:complete